ncbi:tetratricopeptide repeat protein [Elizabethkingia anophelis]|uniref:tetratricopeptide repeat protein n=1 Tax=Elizabethkingia anophelis TaxID=1117645 RepID=UPI000AD207FF|nr:hypothetical protein [Elizabethkingia anophelis]
MNSTKNKYYFEALDHYPYSIPDCVEALNYALSYDPQDADSLCLMARVYSEILKDYNTAKAYFEEAMKNDVTSISIPIFILSVCCIMKTMKRQKSLLLIVLR